MANNTKQGKPPKSATITDTSSINPTTISVPGHTQSFLQKHPITISSKLNPQSKNSPSNISSPLLSINKNSVSSTFIVFNFRGMDPSVTNKDTRHKLVNFCEEHISDNVAVISICESWLKPHVTDAQIYIENYQIIRQDRVKRDCDGVVLYIHNSLPVTSSHYFDDDICEAVICYVNSIKSIFISLYRPPDTPTHSFEKLLQFMQKHIKNISNSKHLDIHIMGDFNLPEMPWNHENSVQKSLSKSGQMLQNFMEGNLLSQYVQEPTRKSNILDLFLSNNSNLVLHCKPIETSLSDHKLVKVQTTHNINTKYCNQKPPIQPHTFRSLNFNKANFDQIDDHLKTVNWDELKIQCSEEEFPELMRLTVL